MLESGRKKGRLFLVATASATNAESCTIWSDLHTLVVSYTDKPPQLAGVEHRARMVYLLRHVVLKHPATKHLTTHARAPSKVSVLTLLNKYIVAVRVALSKGSTLGKDRCCDVRAGEEFCSNKRGNWILVVYKQVL